MTTLITTGSHGKNPKVRLNGRPRVFAHKFDPDDPEGVGEQVRNFVLYAQALGGCDGVELIGPKKPSDLMQVQMADWAGLVRSDLGIQVTVRC